MPMNSAENTLWYFQVRISVVHFHVLSGYNPKPIYIVNSYLVCYWVAMVGFGATIYMTFLSDIEWFFIFISYANTPTLTPLSLSVYLCFRTNCFSSTHLIDLNIVNFQTVHLLLKQIILWSTIFRICCQFSWKGRSVRDRCESCSSPLANVSDQ